MKKRVNTVLSLLVVSQYFKDFFLNKLVLLIFFGIADLFEIDSGQHFNKRFITGEQKKNLFRSRY